MARRILLVSTAAAVVAFAGLQPRLYAADDEARPRDLMHVEEDLANLDEQMRSLRPGPERGDEFQRRAEEIREEVIYLKVKARKHREAGGEGTGIGYAEVSDLRRAIRDLRDDLTLAEHADVPQELRLDPGTRILVRLEQSVSSRTARREDRIDASIARPVRVGDALALPAGTRVRALVRDVEPAERPSKGGRLDLDVDAVYVGDERLDIRSRVVSLGGEPEDQTARRAGIGAAVGGILGAILGGKQGAIVGILVGGGGAVAASKGEDVDLPAGTVVTISLERPLLIPTDVARDR